MTRLVDAFERLEAAKGQASVMDLGQIRAHDFGRFAIAAGRAEWTDGDVAVAHPLFLSAVMGWGDGPPESDLRADGTEPSATAGLPLEGLRLMGAGQDLTVHRAVAGGDHVAMSLSVDDVVLKDGKSGPLIVLTLRREYELHDGTAVATCLETFIAR